ncbi:MAG: HAMP domain-containing histidine kinase [Deltaproteobacteria bacterium]|nr:MAG: HAMP domain-containing histidine kinase [Deltaproteobacteria bacterium]
MSRRPPQLMRDLRLRLVIGSVLGALICVVLTWVGALGTARWWTLGQLEDLRASVGVEALADCAAHPDTWHADEGVYQTWAYDRHGVSRNPAAPPLPEVELGEPGAPSQLLRGLSILPDGLRAVQVVAADGPCAVLYSRPTKRMRGIERAQTGGRLGLGLGVALVVALTSLLAIAPLLRRLRELDTAAAVVGSPEFAAPQVLTDDALGRIAATLTAAHERILADRREREARHSAQERYLAAVAHDLRTPLASLQLMLEGLNREHPESQALGEARLELAYLEAIADNLHQATRLEGGLEARQPGQTEWVAIAERVALRFSILGRVRGNTVLTALPDSPLRADCDPALAERLLANLVHNALVHGTPGSEIVLAVDGTADGFRLVVVNQGAPLTADQAARLGTRRFRDLDTARTRGPGLGVAIVNEIAEAVGWTVRWQPLEGGGLEVVVEG